MSAATTAAAVLWGVLAVASAVTWLPDGPIRTAPLARQRLMRALVLVVLVGLTGLVVLLGAHGGGVTSAWRWVVVAVAGLAACLSGGSFATSVLALADGSTQAAGGIRPQLRGGAWIGAFERLGLLATVLAGWPEGLAVIVAIKALARYPELKETPTSGITERFIIGTFASLAWAAVCTGVVLVLLHT